MKVFVAGGTGVIGRASISALMEAGHQVRATARGAGKAALIRSLGAEPVDMGLYDFRAVRKEIAGMDALARLTTKIPSLRKIGARRAWEETNRLRTEGARILVDAALAEGVPVYIHESVTFVYRDGGADSLTEEWPVDDGGTSILRKALEGESEAARFSQAGARGIVLRFAGLYGADSPQTREMMAMIKRRMLPRIGPGANYFSSISAPDAGRAVAGALEAPPGVFNVCDDDPLPFAEYFRVLAASVRAPRPLRLPGFVGGWIFGDIWSYFSRSLRVSNARLKQATGWKPAVASVREGWPLIATELGW